LPWVPPPASPPRKLKSGPSKPNPIFGHFYITPVSSCIYTLSGPFFAPREGPGESQKTNSGAASDPSRRHNQPQDARPLPSAPPSLGQSACSPSRRHNQRGMPARFPPRRRASANPPPTLRTGTTSRGMPARFPRAAEPRPIRLRAFAPAQPAAGCQPASLRAAAPRPIRLRASHRHRQPWVRSIVGRGKDMEGSPASVLREKLERRQALVVPVVTTR